MSVVVNGWDAVAKDAPARLQRLALEVSGEPGNGTWVRQWVSPPTTREQGSGRLALFAAPRANGSVVVAGWNGAVQFN